MIKIVRQAFSGYIKYIRWAVGIYLLSAVTLLVIAQLSHLAMEPVFYALTISGAVSAAVLASGFPAYLSRHRELLALMENSGGNLGPLPAAADLLEQDYQVFLHLLDASRLESLERAEAKKEREQQYYTLWAHQVKTPIAAMRLLLQEETEAPKAEMKQELFKVEQYVEMALQFLRLDAGENDLLLEEIPLERTVKRAVKRVSGMFIHKKLALTLGDLSKSVVTDEKWLLFVLEQLLTNAVKYTKTGSVFIGIEEGQTLIIRDTGIGIRAEDLPRVFEWGYTGYNGRADQRATGIGLYLTRQALALLGHTIKLESEEGKGVCVSIHFGREKLEIE